MRVSCQLLWLGNKECNNPISRGEICIKKQKTYTESLRRLLSCWGDTLRFELWLVYLSPHGTSKQPPRNIMETSPRYKTFFLQVVKIIISHALHLLSSLHTYQYQQEIYFRRIFVDLFHRCDSHTCLVNKNLGVKHGRYFPWISFGDLGSLYSYLTDHAWFRNG